jgi:drug/metabolite transporter (DMT)-like permease
MAHLEVKPKSKSRWWLWLLIVIVLIAAIAYFFYYNGYPGKTAAVSGTADSSKVAKDSTAARTGTNK